MHTSITLLRQSRACAARYKRLVKHLGGVTKYGTDTPIPLTVVLESNGLDDALWCLRAVLPDEEERRNRLARLLACDYVEHVLPLWESVYPADGRPRAGIETARGFVLGQVTPEMLAAAMKSAEAAIGDPRDAAKDVAWVAWAAILVGRDALWTGRVAWATENVRHGEAAKDAEREWQAACFLQYLNGEEATAELVKGMMMP